MGLFRKLFNKQDQSTKNQAEKITKDYSEVFKLAYDAIGEDNVKAYNLYKECFENKYEETKCAESLGLISFNDLNNIKDTLYWFNKAVELGSREEHVYLYIEGILSSQRKMIPGNIAAVVDSARTQLSYDTIQKIKKLSH